ncbi:ImmA/IrrE family metallo-endopeptidase [Actinospica sp. MGRD01-02]|uniref:ImmA/IrrE family metallo-endopeptidase n=1 Tax=Actinospica acidithermotolerans TaxID=2828514 RepID=A0A941EGD8_9ACTN|nr:ImmA/IrrE family metallo-endopeptidase [Actinospica acidithermotolerans]MBR7829908.1 ImmA/IrrE family metallo-endopeptidase [Actinospica acidithermotolerans]
MKQVARADLLARQLLEEVGWTSLPVDPEQIADQLGIIVANAPMTDDVSGMLVREPDRIVIGVNQTHHINRKRFTIAHEIGHLKLHKGRSVIMDSDVRMNFRDRVASLATDREEIEANRFAAALLMPEHVVRPWVAEQSFRNAAQMVEQFADTFRVSPSAANFRLVNLGIIPTPVEI